jgi:hypothetical protein
MDSSVCWKCIEDKYLSEIVKRDGEPRECSLCHGTERNAYAVEDFGQLLEPILREHYERGREIRTMGEDDRNDGWEQEGELLSFVLQEVLGQYFGFEDEIVRAVMRAEDVDPRDGDIPFFEDDCNYVERPPSLDGYFAEWNLVTQELKHKRRFFSSAARALFDKLFIAVDAMSSWSDKERKYESVVWELPAGSELFRARICDSHSGFQDVYSDPLKHVGPPPADRARAGRMNVEGVVVFYGATDLQTCLAEMRPSLGGDTAVIMLRATKPLRMLDFTRLEKSHHSNGLSYFQADFSSEVERGAFLRRIHSLISQPITPGRESNYLITQTLAEYLAYEHNEPFDGILFASVQRAEGVNVVLFPDRRSTSTLRDCVFPLTYVDDSIKVYSTSSIQYEHRQRYMRLVDGEISIEYDPDADPDSWFY